jgi:hypothetical protein
MTHKGLLAIKEIVKIAPQEAQWFHTVEPIVYNDSPENIHLLLSDKLFIPTQNTSAAQVDTTATMMIDFYKDLKEDYEDQNIVNQKLSKMTCWCHSHHNMAPNPSSQDNDQFDKFIKLSEDQGQPSWQIMLIFNKKDQFYSKVYNPHNKTIHEGVSIIPVNEYDFDYIHSAAKTKFKKTEAPSSKFFSRKAWWTKNTTTTRPDYTHSKKNSMPSMYRGVDSIDKIFQDSHMNPTDQIDSVNWDIINEILTESFEWYDPYNIETQKRNKEIVLTKSVGTKLLSALELYLDDRETIFFTYLLSRQAEKIIPIFTEKAFEKRFGSMDYASNELKIATEYETNILNTSVFMDNLIEALQGTLDLADIQTKKTCKEYLEKNGHI